MTQRAIKKGLVIVIILFFVGSSVAHSNTNLLNNRYNPGYKDLGNIDDNIFPKFNESKKTKSYSQNSSFKGYTLYSSDFSTYSYIINNDGDVLNTWESDFLPGHSCYLQENGNLLRATFLGHHPTFLLTGGIAGGVQEFDLNNNVVWNFVYSNSYFVSHHDIEPLPSGNVLMIAWEFKTENEAIANGRNPDLINYGQLWPDHIIEVEPTGPNSGDIVWEWHVWDHLIQDYDPSKDNYGVVADHPELIDINYVIDPDPESVYPDWLHSNSIDYNEEFDQILISVRYFSEIWVIDHSTTTEEAAGHTGGNSGKGGDILYRWGNPRAYGRGTIDDQKFFQQHDARWIEPDYPGEGNILVFNNGLERPDFNYSSVDEIVPPVDSYGNYYLESGEAYGPETSIWNYTASNPEDFFSGFMSGAQRLPNGNTLICSTAQTEFFEVTPENEIVWQYFVNDPVFKINRYAIDFQGIQELLPEPYKPNIPNGPTNGTVKVNYSYTTNTTDPNGDQIYYWFDWGDGNSSGWIGPYESEENCVATNMWSNGGFFEIKVKAKDNYDYESFWSNPLLVYIEPPNYPPYMPSDPDPYNGETNVDFNADLSWSGGDPNPGDTVTYDVYLEADDPTPDILVSNDQSQTTFDPGTMEFETHYYWKIVATDNHGKSTIGPVWDFITEDAPENFPPKISEENPENLAENISISLTELSVYFSDPEYDLFSWTIETSPDIGSCSGTDEHDGTKVCSITVILDFSTIYTWYVNATDTESGYTSKKIYKFTTVDNKPPDVPDIDGPPNGKPGIEYTFCISTTDPDGDSSHVKWDWGDGTSTDWSGPFASGTEVCESHKWSKSGKYIIMATVRDDYGLITTASLEFIIPRTRAYWLRFFDMFPMLQRLLNFIR